MRQDLKTQMIILASGSGQRFGGKLPKQYVKIAGKTVLEHTIDRIERCRSIASVIIVVNQDYYEYVNELILKNQFFKVKKIVCGGDTRQESSYAGICACDEDTVNVLLHDAIRPFVSEKIIEKTVKALSSYEAVDVAIPCADTVIRINEENCIADIPPRNFLRRGQTPQGFRLSLIKEAYRRFRADGSVSVTDDCGLITHYGLADVYVVDGEEQNIKITYKEDAYLADKLFQIHSMSLLKNEEEGTSWKDKTAVIFGHTSGIGRDIYETIQSRGGHVYGYARSDGTDIRCYEDVERALKETCRREGKIDYVVNTAAILEIVKLEAMTPQEIAYMMEVNYMGAVHVTKAALPYLKETRGSLLLFTSSSYTRGRAMYSMYSSSKAAVVNFMQAVSEEVYADGIRINVLNPERTDTPMRRRNFGLEPEGSLLESKRVAEAALRVLSTSLTGQVVDVRRADEGE